MVSKIISRICMVTAVIFFVLIVVNTSFVKMPTATVWIVVSTLLCQAGLLFLLKKYLKPFKHFGVVLFAARFVLCMVFIVLTTAEPSQDFLRMYSAGCDIANGSREYLQNDYFYRFAYQTGFSAYEGLVLFLTGGSMLAIKVLNALYMSVTTLLVYLISKEFVSEKSAMCAGIFYLIYPAPIYLSGVLTNQHLSVMLLVLAMYILVKKLTPLRFLASGAILALSKAMCPVALIAVIAGVIYGIYTLFEKFDVRRLLGIVLLPLGYVVTGFVLSVLVVASGLNPEGLSNNRPKWMFVVGLSEHGIWNKADYDSLMFLPEAEVDQAMSDVAKERAVEYGVSGFWDLFDEKITVMWGKLEDMSWAFSDRTSESWAAAKDNMAAYEKGSFLFALLLATVGLVGSLKKNIRADLLPILIFCGYFAVYLIIEIQSRYRYVPTVAMFCILALGVEVLNRKDKKLQK